MRVLIYSHDTYGLGHLRRSIAIAEALVTKRTDSSVLIVTGSPRAQSYDLPPRCDTMKLPTILKQANGSYASRDLDLSLDEIVALRARLIASAFHDFRPDVVLIDHAPLGVAGELLPLLDALRRDRRGARLVLGMRDVVDEARRVERAWRDEGVLEALERDYDRILVYGSTAVATTAVELGLGRLLDRDGRPKVRHVGYLARSFRPRPTNGRILITTGGGGDGHGLLRRFLGYLERGGDAPCGADLVIGPFLSERRRQEIHRRARELGPRVDLRVIDFDENLQERIASSAGVIAMAGYNTVVEILAAARPALLVPRERPRMEQLIRAMRLDGQRGIEYRRLHELDDEVIRGFVAGLAATGRSPEAPVDLGGLGNTVAELVDLVGVAGAEVAREARFPGHGLMRGSR